jgi:D-cysteine desulfhydrase family pyridoxal phosphate-dependent enzyme
VVAATRRDGAYVTLAFVPTPVEPLPRLSDALGGPRIFVKRDDLTGLALGGNKARKLERICTEAVQQGCDVLVTGGGIQSNHVRQTAAAARIMGLECHAVLGGADVETPSGNHLLDELLGATIEVVDAPRYDDVEREIVAAADRLRAGGRSPYAIPVGGANAAGVQAYADAAGELLAQRNDIDTIFVADGSGGTHAGLLIGFGDDGPRIVGVDVGTRPDLDETVPRLAGGRSALVDHDHIGAGYGELDARTLDALRLAARTEGLLLDPVYTGKAFAAMCAWIDDGRISARDNVLFWHTGGQPALFASRYAKQLMR